MRDLAAVKAAIELRRDVLVALGAGVLAASLACAQMAPAVGASKEPKVPHMQPPPEACEVESSWPGVDCLVRQRKLEDTKLDAAYSSALRALPEKSESDLRRSKAQLRVGQKAWKSYRVQHCPVVGAMDGGNISGTPEFSSKCRGAV